MEVTTEHPALAGLLPKDRAETVRRFRIVTELNELIKLGKSQGHRADELIVAYLALLRSRGVGMSATSVHSWRRAYRLDGLRGLVDRRRLSKKRPADPVDLGPFLQLVREGYHALAGSALSHRVALEFAYFDACRKSEHQPWKTCGFRESFSLLNKELRPSLAVQAGAMPAIKARSKSLQSEFDRAS